MVQEKARLEYRMDPSYHDRSVRLSGPADIMYFLEHAPVPRRADIYFQATERALPGTHANLLVSDSAIVVEDVKGIGSSTESFTQDIIQGFKVEKLFYHAPPGMQLDENFDIKKTAAFLEQISMVTDNGYEVTRMSYGYDLFKSEALVAHPKTGEQRSYPIEPAGIHVKTEPTDFGFDSLLLSVERESAEREEVATLNKILDSIAQRNG